MKAILMFPSRFVYFTFYALVSYLILNPIFCAFIWAAYDWESACDFYWRDFYDKPNYISYVDALLDRENKKDN